MTHFTGETCEADVAVAEKQEIRSKNELLAQAANLGSQSSLSEQMRRGREKFRP